MSQFRVIDSGIRGARANIAFDQALIDAHRAGQIPNTIRFLRFERSVLVGRHQLVSSEIHRDYCLENNIEIARRITGGGAIYFDRGQLGWELVFSRNTFGSKDLSKIAETICGAAALGLRKLGVDARFRPRNDIEVGGRKLCGTGGFFDGDSVFYQGTLLIESDPEEVVRALNVPKAKLEKRDLDRAAQRLVTLKELLPAPIPGIGEIQTALLEGFEEQLGITLSYADPSSTEEEQAMQNLADEIGADTFVYELDNSITATPTYTGTVSVPGGTVSAHVRLEGAHSNRLREVMFSGDFFISPPRILFDLEAALRGVSVIELASVLGRFFDNASIETLSLEAATFQAALEAALHNV